MISCQPAGLVAGLQHSLFSVWTEQSPAFPACSSRCTHIIILLTMQSQADGHERTEALRVCGRSKRFKLITLARPLLTEPACLSHSTEDFSIMAQTKLCTIRSLV